MANTGGWGGATTSPQSSGNTGGWGGGVGVSTTPIATSSGFNAMYESVGDTLYDQDLIDDKNFIEASKIIYQMNNGKYAQGFRNDQDYARYGIEMMGWFNWNLPKMTLDASRISGANESQKRAFLYMMESYDDLGLSWNGTARLFKGALTDPTTYIGLGTFGLGTVAAKGTAAVTKEGVKSVLRQSVKGGIIAGTEAGIYGAVDDINRQVVETAVSGEDIDLGRTAKAGATTAVLGFGLGAGVTGVAKKVQLSRAEKKAKAETTTKKVNDVDELPEMTTAETVAAQTPVGRIRTQLDTVVKAIKRTVPAGKVAAITEDGTQNLDELVKTVEPIQEIVAKASAKNPLEFVDFLNKQEFAPGQREALEVVTNQTASVLKTKVFQLRQQQAKLSGDEAKAIGDQIDKIEKVIQPIDQLDSALSTITGQTLRARAEGLNTGEVRGMTIASLQEQGLTRSDAEKRFDEIFAEKLIKKERTREIKQLDTQIEEARVSGDQAREIELKHERKLKVAEFKEEALRQEETVFQNLYRQINKPINVLNEIMISFVFSPATVIINTVPSLAKVFYKPFLNNLMRDGLSSASLKTMMSEYTAMASFAPSALKAARAAWRYERSMLTGDSARFLEDYNTIPKKFGGGVIRFFPRLLLTTDALFENIHYRGFTVGNATATAIEDGVAKGKKGKELDDFVKERVQKSLDDAYEPEENAIDILMTEGISRGLKGHKLQNFINRELEARPEAFQKATNKEGRDYVQDVLFKRDFSGKGSASKLAKGYEAYVNKNPIMRMAGQLFFRTPVRVFEEGIRLTPGLNLISPGFLSDLSGANGSMRQIRAQGEAMMSYAIAGSVFSLYATGNVTGSLGEDYKQRRQAENAGELEPYSMRFSDGSTFNFRNFDPFSTPIKIMVNALERAETLMYRAEQGEKISQTDMMFNQAMISVAVGSVAQSIRDANLASGVDAIFTLVEDLQDEDGSEQLIKFAGQKVQTFLPNTYYKIQMLDNPVLGDPATLEAFIRYRINPDDPLVPKQYTALGRPRTLSNPMANLIYFDRSTAEEKKRGVPDKELRVEQFLYRLAQVGNTHFTAPYQHKFLRNVDLRTRMTSDGKESYYDRWMRYTHESGLIDALDTLRGLPMGTESDVGVAEAEAKSMINEFREISFIKLMMEESGVTEEYIRNEIMRAENQAGMNYIPNIQFQGNN